MKKMFSSPYQILPKINLFVLLFSFNLIVGLNAIKAECSLTVTGQDFTCYDNGTPTDPSDDEYKVEIGMYDDNTGLTWEADFGPYSVTAAAPTVTVVHPNDTTCSIQVTIQDPPTSCVAWECPDWNTSIQLIGQNGCEYTYVLNIESAGFDPSFNIDFLNLRFHISGNGVFSSVNYYDIYGEMATKETTLEIVNNNELKVLHTQNEPLESYRITGPQVVFTVTGEPQTCFEITRVTNSFIHIQSSEYYFCNVTGAFEPISECTEGVLANGLVTSYSNEFGPCPNTIDLGIEGAEVSITGANGSCNAITGSNGGYGCYLCEGGPYQICVNTTCPEPCGLTDLDILIIQRHILGYPDPWPSVMNFMGDVNMNGIVTAADILQIRKWLLFGTSDTKNWCRFVPVAELNNKPTSFSAIDNCITVDDPTQGIDFVRFMLGDMNGSCDDCTHEKEIIKGGVPISFITNDDNTDIKLNSNDTIYAISLHINIENENLISDISTPLPNAEYSIKNGELHFIWFDQSETKTGIKLEPNSSILNIHLRDNINSSLNTGENLVLTKSGIYQITNGNLQLRNNFTQKTLEIEGKYINFAFEGEGSNTVIDVYDINGRLLFAQNIDFGSDKVYVDYDFAQAGVYLINIKNSSNNIVKKLFVEQ